MLMYSLSSPFQWSLELAVPGKIRPDERTRLLNRFLNQTKDTSHTPAKKKKKKLNGDSNSV